MKSKYFFSIILLSVFALTSCGDDEPDDLTILNAKINGSTWVDGMTDVDLDVVMEITFSKAIDPSKVVSNSSLGSTGPIVNSTASFSTDSLVMMVTTDPLANMEDYTLSIMAGTLAADGGMLVNDYERSFTTK